jgi:hypothetical protein
MTSIHGVTVIALTCKSAVYEAEHFSVNGIVQ